jgi:hypothetical protein
MKGTTGTISGRKPRLQCVGWSICVFWGLLSYAHAATIDVPADFADIQAAIDDPGTTAGDEIIIAPGQYLLTATIDFKGKAIILRSTNPTDPNTVAATILDGQGSIDHVVKFASSEGPASILRGFTIMGGNAESSISIDKHGGGVLIFNSSPTVSYCVFLQNSAQYGGGGLYCEASSNQARPKIFSCIFMGNNAREGGGIGLVNGLPTISNCLLVANSAQVAGGIWNRSDSTIVNSTIYGNLAAQYGGGLHSSQVLNPTLTNSVVWANVDASGMGEAAQVGVNGGELSVTYCNIQGGWSGSGQESNISVEPLFMDIDGLDNILGTLDDDFRLQPASPCIDAGLTAAMTQGVTADLAANPRVVNCLVDIGAYEFNETFIADSDGDGIADDCDQCPGFDDRADADGDGIANGCDSPTVQNLTQTTDHFAIQDAIDASINGDTIVIHPGTYRLTDPIDLKGRAITLRGSNPTDPNTVAATLLDGQGRIFHVLKCVSGEGTDTIISGLTISGGNANAMNPLVDSVGGGLVTDNGSGPTVTHCHFRNNSVYFHGGAIYNNENSATVIMHCTFTENLARERGGAIYNGLNSQSTVADCVFTFNMAEDGSGIFNGERAEPTISDSTFRFNTATQSGGGIYSGGKGCPVITRCTFEMNEVVSGGGGIYNNDVDATVSYCHFRGNIVTGSRGDGGGMVNYSGEAIVTNCSFVSNIVGEDGGGLMIHSDHSVITNCLFIGNFAAEDGGGLANNDNTASIINCTFIGNTAVSGGGLHNDEGKPKISNSVFWDNGPDTMVNVDGAEPTITHCNIQGGLPTGSVDDGGNIDADPLFVDPLGPDNTAATGDENLRLLAGSPCFDAGYFFVLPRDLLDLDDDGDQNERIPIDLDDNPRIVNGIVDIGAYESRDCDQDGSDDLVDSDDDTVPDVCDSCPGSDDRVDSDSDGIPDGCDSPSIHNRTQGTHYFIVKDAIAEAVNGDLIEVDTGLYVAQSINFLGKAVTLRSTSGNPTDTIFDGQGRLTSIVTCNAGEGSDTVLKGFTIKGGEATNTGFLGDCEGGGMDNRNSSPTVMNCIFDGNAACEGGGIYNYNSQPTIVDCTFVNNTAGYGGGMCNYESHPTVIGCHFINNTGGLIGGGGGGMVNGEDSCPDIRHSTFEGNIAHTGGGILNDWDNTCITVTNCAFIGNSSITQGGGMYNRGQAEVTSCTFIGNTAGSDGGGVHNGDSATKAFTNCTFVANTAVDGGGMYNSTSDLTIANCIIRENVSSPPAQFGFPNGALFTVAFSNVQDGLPVGVAIDGGGNIDLDPLFVDPNGPDTIAGTSDDNLRLQSLSPCINSGDNGAATGASEDLDGTERIVDGTVDMGAYEFQDCDHDGTDDIVDDDGDTVPDDCDVCPGFDDLKDSDGDLIPDCLDTPGVHNRTQGTDFFAIHDALQQAVDFDRIDVDPGSYAIDQAIDFLGKAVTLQSTCGDATVTTIDGQGRVYHVVQCVSGEGPGTVLSGFTLTGGLADDIFPNDRGAGIYIDASSPTVNGCIIRDNTAKYGGGISCRGINSSAVFTGCTVENNHALSEGGGVYNNQSSSPSFADCQIRRNQATTRGGGVYNTDVDNPVFTRCVIRENRAGSDGGGVYGEFTHSHVLGCQILGNSASGAGGGLYVRDFAPLTLRNSVVSGNVAMTVGGGIYYLEANGSSIDYSTITGNVAGSDGGGIHALVTHLTISNTVHWNNSPLSFNIIASGDADVSTSVITDLAPSDINDNGGNIDVDPFFRRSPDDGGDGWADDPTTLNLDERGNNDYGDLRLQTDSPCLNAGSDTPVTLPDGTDVEGNARVIYERSDMGAYEFFLQGDFDLGGSVNINDLSAMAIAWLRKNLTYDVAPQSRDGLVNWIDFASLPGTTLLPDATCGIAELAREWLSLGTTLPDLTPGQGDGTFDLRDFAVLASNWLVEIQIITDETLLGYWRFDEEQGSIASNDGVDPVNEGVLMNMGNEDWIAGYQGNALAFDGIDDFVETSSFQGITGMQSRTCSAWIKTDAVGDILSWGSNETGRRWLVLLNGSTTQGIEGALRVAIVGGYAIGTTDLRNGNWHHIAVVLADDGSTDVSEIQFYVDGQPDLISQTQPLPIDTADTEPVRIGVRPPGTTDLYFQGLIDEVRIYNRALSGAEIMNLANQ